MATTKYIDIKLRTKSAETSADKLDGKMKGLGTTVDKTSNSFGVLSKVAAAVGTAIVTGQITRYADAYTSLQNQVRQTTKSTEELTERTADLLSLANRSRAGISSTAEAYTQLTLATEALNLTDERRLRLTETIAKSFTIAGKTQAQAEESTRQLNQAFSSGVLRGQEYNTIIENAPEIFRALQKSTGKTAGELRKLADTGQISSSVLITALDEAASTIDTKFNNSTATMAQNIEVANNNLTEFIGSSTTVQNVMGGLGGAIVTASENISTIASGAVLVSSIFAARLIPSILTYSSSLIANTATQLTNGTAATKTANVYGVVTVSAASATVATNALTLAARAATTAMTFLGGPLGIALIAGTALFAFNDIAFNTKDATEKGAKGVNELTSAMEKLKKQTVKAQLATIIKIEDDILLKLSRAEKQVENLKKLSEDTRGKSTFLGAAEREVERLSNALDDISAKRVALIGGIDTSVFDNADESANKKAPTETPKQSQYSINLAQETEALQIELALRQQVEQGYLSQRDADLSASFVVDNLRRTTAFEAELLSLGANEEAKVALTEEFKANQILREQLYQESLTGIEQEAADKRVSIAEQEALDKQKFFDGLLNTSVNLGVALLKNEISSNAKSEKEKKRARKKGVLIDTAAGIARAFAENNFYTALGISAAIAANGLTQISAINSASSVAAPTESSGAQAQSVTSATSTAPPVRNRTVDIRTDGSAFSEAVKDAALVLFNSGDDDVVLNITNAQNELIRTGGAG